MAVQADSTEPLQKKSDVSLLIRSKKLCWKPIPFCQSVHEPFVCAKFTLWQERCVPLPNEQAIMELPPTKCTIILCKPEAFWHFPNQSTSGIINCVPFLETIGSPFKDWLKIGYQSSVPKHLGLMKRESPANCKGLEWLKEMTTFRNGIRGEVNLWRLKIW